MKLADNWVTIWEIKEVKGMVFGKSSEGIKNKEGKYDNIYWDLMFLGDCKESAKTLIAKDRIIIKGGIVENRYNKETQKLSVTVKVFEFEGAEAGERADKVADVEEIDDNELPF